MLIGVIQKSSLAEAAALIQRMDTSLYDLLELRLDACQDVSVEGIKALSLPLPAIFTLRRKDEGGAFGGSEEERLALLADLIRLKPAYMDLEASIDADRIAAIRALSPETAIILSKHDFEGTPTDLEGMLSTMQAKAKDVIYKFATQANSTLDTLRMLNFCKEKTAQGLQVLGICMGEDGSTTRILAPVVHTGLCYCPVEEESAPGQIDAATLRDIYHFPKLNHDTAIFALLGDPVSQSVGHIYHSKRMEKCGYNGVYVKWRLTKEELPLAIPMLIKLGVKGMSVTMPLKETIIPLLAGQEPEAGAIGAVNTLKAVEGGFAGTNTDGGGALSSLGLNLKDKNVVLLGAGGAGKAIMFEAAKQGAKLTIFNRTVNKVIPVDAPILPYSELSRLETQPCDVIINTLPFDIPLPFEHLPFPPGVVVMDISYGKKSQVLEMAKAAGRTCVDGSGMFDGQAELQWQYWGLIS